MPAIYITLTVVCVLVNPPKVSYVESVVQVIFYFVGFVSLTQESYSLINPCDVLLLAMPVLIYKILWLI